ncbi:glycoside hydrolase family 2 TIM barrel-domain containing protein [Polaribacter sp. Hel1_85]|uniref:glycoside hydrolase family 2 TIM barrel-domain containing protein n=1 Tax=Polaribacter sp. Hel1_85 TaxID=1250005 RepID=UPI0012DFFC26|nr:glycoside hydrolase family 2 TIM barrel-domain containing protein [Polaribacter sp. Hel1_85]
MKSNLTLISIICLFLMITGCSQPEKKTAKETKTNIELKDNWYYLNGEKFFIKAIGYEIAARPGEHPYEDEKKDHLELMKYDLENIKKGGYNTIRTWSQYSEAQLKLVQESGLKLIMGLNVNPEEDYRDPKFINHCKTQLEKILEYAPKYDCIISYLVINEPQTDHIHKVSAKAFKDLMKMMVDMIHKDHPGIPVTLSANAMISDWMDQSMFDVYAYNCYGYNEGQTATIGFSDYIKGLNTLNGLDKPFIITEFGHSVSPKGGFGSFGSRTLKEQSEGLVSNYRELIDAGALGMCPFYYADGWWKGGEKSTHNKEQPEEWFGFWGYKDVNDKYGSPRPVWFAMKEYMKGLILSPKNKTIHTNTTIPIELYNNKEVKKVVVKLSDEVIYSKNIESEGYFADQLTINPEGIEALELAFEFYNSKNEVIKNESIVILTSKTEIELPKLTIEVTPEKDLNESKNASIKTKIVTNDNFKLISNLIVSYNTHLGWDVGQQVSVPVKDQLDKKIITSENTFFIPDNSWVVNASAGISVRYGKFTFKIHDQKIIYRGDWAKEISRK